MAGHLAYETQRVSVALHKAVAYEVLEAVGAPQQLRRDVGYVFLFALRCPSALQQPVRM